MLRVTHNPSAERTAGKVSKKGAKEALLEAGLELIRTIGYGATGINQVLDAADTRSFYSYFASKEQFVLEVIQQYVAECHQHMERIMNDPGLPALERLRRYFEDMIAVHGCNGGPIKGCLLGNLSLEIAGQNAEVRDLLRESFGGWQRSIAMTIHEAIKNGELPETARANEIAAVIVDSWQGAQVREKTQQDDRALNLFLETTFHDLLRAGSDFRN